MGSVGRGGKSVGSGKVGSVGVGSGMVGSGIGGSAMFKGSAGTTGSGAGGTISAALVSGKGPIGSPSSPVSPSGIEEGAATGSEKTGSTLVALVILSIAVCKSLSKV